MTLFINHIGGGKGSNNLIHVTLRRPTVLIRGEVWAWQSTRGPPFIAHGLKGEKLGATDGGKGRRCL
ncbi:hypothetical protein E2C01_081880 [Portunus trituberculatus]|uniref:Uncharacterized protein n=1 Tax=Portunus trituberculatus TaxID=210409 RepID=A0A5B7INI7_PORTR|nr:hypothetical protein [Portunus trituberculatus]